MSRATATTKAKKVRSEPKLRASFLPKTIGQRDYLDTLMSNIVTFATGPAGCGKSYIGLGLACQYLIEGRYDYLILARPTVEASKRGLGYIPGDISAKMSPYAYPTVEHLKKFLGSELYENYSSTGIIKIEPIEYMRGRTYDNAFMILDEAQNATYEQITMFVTRIGEDSKVLISGDIEQTDLLSKYDMVDLERMISKIESAKLQNFGVARLNENDIVRNPIISGFLRAIK